MPETWGRRDPNSQWWTNPFVLEALAQRDDDEYGIKGLIARSPMNEEEPESLERLRRGRVPGRHPPLETLC